MEGSGEIELNDDQIIDLIGGENGLDGEDLAIAGHGDQAAGVAFFGDMMAGHADACFIDDEGTSGEVEVELLGFLGARKLTEDERGGGGFFGDFWPSDFFVGRLAKGDGAGRAGEG